MSDRTHRIPTIALALPSIVSRSNGSELPMVWREIAAAA